MPNYIRSQSPWVSAAEGANNGLNVLANMYGQLPQIRAQMQNQANQLALQQGQLDLNQQEHLAKVPMYQAQTANWQAEADKNTAGAQQLKMLLDLAKTAQAGKFAERGGLQLQNGQGPTIENAQNAGTAQLLAALAGASTLAPDSAQRALAAEQEPLKLNAGQTAFDKGMNPMAQGLVNAPFGNMIQQGMKLPGSPTMQQEGQFRPSAAGVINPSTELLNLVRAAEMLNNIGTKSKNPSVSNILNMVTQKASGLGGSAQAPAASGPQIGEVIDGYTFLGGDPAKPESWRKQ